MFENLNFNLKLFLVSYQSAALHKPNFLSPLTSSTITILLAGKNMLNEMGNDFFIIENLYSYLSIIKFNPFLYVFAIKILSISSPFDEENWNQPETGTYPSYLSMHDGINPCSRYTELSARFDEDFSIFSDFAIFWAFGHHLLRSIQHFINFPCRPKTF